MAMTVTLPGAPLFAEFKKLVGIPEHVAVEKIVVELDCRKVPKIYVKAPLFSREQMAAIPDALKLVAEVVVADDCSVTSTTH